MEMLLHDKEFGDGTLHVEWRWRKDEDPRYVYTGCIYVRAAPNGKSWVQAHVARQDKAPIVGGLVGMIRELYLQTGMGGQEEGGKGRKGAEGEGVEEGGEE